VHDAASVADAPWVFDHVKPDLVVLDMQLPDGNGFDVLEHIRSRGDGPTLFVTAATGIEDWVAALDRGPTTTCSNRSVPKSSWHQPMPPYADT
jgi:DNA-binding response OmpR family regulator